MLVRFAPVQVLAVRRLSFLFWGGGAQMDESLLTDGERAKIVNWERKHVFKDELSIHEAACFLANFHPALTPSNAMQSRIYYFECRLFDSVLMDAVGRLHLLEYEARRKDEEHPEQSTFPKIAFERWRQVNNEGEDCFNDRYPLAQSLPFESKQAAIPWQTRKAIYVWEFAHLLAGIEPDYSNESDGIPKKAAVWLGVLKEDLRHKRERFVLCGVTSLNLPWGENDASFPIDAYKKFCMERGISWPELMGGNDALYGGINREGGKCAEQNGDECGINECAKQKVEIPPAPDDLSIVDGLTVADVRRMCERSGALASVLRAVAQWQAIEKENPERMTKESLIAGLKRAARRDGWGAQKGELAEKSQSEPLRKMILDEWRPGGRPRKDANN